jgi:hypothetical protein
VLLYISDQLHQRSVHMDSIYSASEAELACMEISGDELQDELQDSCTEEPKGEMPTTLMQEISAVGCYGGYLDIAPPVGARQAQGPRPPVNVKVFDFERYSDKVLVGAGRRC